MSQTFNINQFAQVPLKGALDLGIMNSKVITGIVSENQATDLVPGQRVKLDTTAQEFIPSFVAAGDTEVAFGYVIYNSRNSANLEAGQPVEVASNFGPVMWMEADEAIAAGATVYFNTTGIKVDVQAGSDKKVGIALDGALADGDLIRVIITTPVAINT